MIIDLEKSLLARPGPGYRWGAFPRHAGFAWAIVSTLRINGLVVAPRPILDVVSRAVAATFCRPIVQCALPGPLGFADVRGGTLILNDVAKLTRPQQQKVLQWSGSGVQIVSMTSDDLFALVNAGEFVADLFYRLNVIRIDCDTALRDSPRARRIRPPSRARGAAPRVSPRDARTA